jgi:hypothetical protein
MSACIALFEAIDPLVVKIETIAGDSKDTAYFKIGDRWVAVWPDVVRTHDDAQLLAIAAAYAAETPPRELRRK